MSAVFTRDSWLSIKKMQGRRLHKDTIARKTGWSEATVERVMHTRTFPEYRRVIAKATESIRRRRAAIAWQKRDDFIVAPKPKRYNFTANGYPDFWSMLTVGIVVVVFILVILLGKKLSE